MSSQHSGLKLQLNDALVDIEDACKTHASVVREAFVDILLLIGLDDNILQRIRLGEAFRRSLQTERRSTPYRLHSVISACKESAIDNNSLEAKFYRHGGTRAVTALAAAAVDGNDIMHELECLTDNECESLVNSINRIRWHPDLEFMAESMNRKRTAITSKKTQLVRPRPSRYSKDKPRNSPSQKEVRQRKDRIHPPQPGTIRSVVSAYVHANAQTPNASELGATHLSPSARLSSAEVAMNNTNTSTPAYDSVFEVATGTDGTIAEGNFGIDLDDMSYGIDLDGINNSF